MLLKFQADSRQIFTHSAPFFRGIFKPHISMACLSQHLHQPLPPCDLTLLFYAKLWFLTDGEASTVETANLILRKFLGSEAFSKFMTSRGLHFFLGGMCNRFSKAKPSGSSREAYARFQWSEVCCLHFVIFFWGNKCLEVACLWELTDSKWGFQPLLVPRRFYVEMIWYLKNYFGWCVYFPNI
jgi:hypothetical protein